SSPPKIASHVAGSAPGMYPTSARASLASSSAATSSASAVTSPSTDAVVTSADGDGSAVGAAVVALGFGESGSFPVAQPARRSAVAAARAATLRVYAVMECHLKGRGSAWCELYVSAFTA